MSAGMPGRRMYPNGEGDLLLAEGDYGRDLRDGIWYARPPGSHMGSLAGHEVIEHTDGTITVSPSIRVLTGDENGDVEQFHGYLERGVWRRC